MGLLALVHPAGRMRQLTALLHLLSGNMELTLHWLRWSQKLTVTRTGYLSEDPWRKRKGDVVEGRTDMASLTGRQG